MLKDYGVTGEVLALYCDNLSAINILKNPVQHSRTKHIDIRRHYIQSLLEGKLIYLRYITTEYQLADIITRGLDSTRYESLLSSIGLCIL